MGTREVLSKTVSKAKPVSKKISIKYLYFGKHSIPKRKSNGSKGIKCSKSFSSGASFDTVTDSISVHLFSCTEDNRYPDLTQ